MEIEKHNGELRMVCHIPPREKPVDDQRSAGDTESSSHNGKQSGGD